MRVALFTLISAVSLFAGGHGHHALTRNEAKEIAEVETLGEAIATRLVHAKGSTHWEVTVHMAEEERGWRVLIDRETGKLWDMVAIKNPAPRKSRHGG